MKANLDNKNIKILIVEDEHHIAEGIKLNLSILGYQTLIAEDGVKALEYWKTFRPDLIILDLMLPHIDGHAVLKKIRSVDNLIPIMIVSAKFEAHEKIDCFENGVDDYLCKPFNLEEFLLRVARLIKRTDWMRDESSKSSIMKEIDLVNIKNYTFGNNSIDFQSNKANNGEDDILLTQQEVKLLKLFILNKEAPLSRKKILEHAFGYENQTSVTTRTIDSFIVRFRKYFEESSKSPMHFKSIRSIGYVFYP